MVENIKLKLMLVDDESYTREGLYKSLPWNDIGIGYVFRADDGLSCLKIMEEHNPDILVTDIRMPQMDGVELAQRVRQRFPDCKIIFMTAYSDKEYLKSAINLRISRFVEKPIILAELEQAVRQAALECIGETESKKKAAQLASTYYHSMSLLKKDLVIELCRKPEAVGVHERLKYIAPEFCNKVFFTTILFALRFKNSNNSEGYAQMQESKVRQTLDEYASCFGLQCIAEFKGTDIVIAHIAIREEQTIHQRELLGNYVAAVIKALLEVADVFASVGKIVRNETQIYTSYGLAVVGLQKLFFCGYNRWVYASDNSSTVYSFSEELLEKFKALLDNRDYGEVSSFLKTTFADIRRHNDTLPDNVKDFVFKLLQQIFKVSEESKIDLFSGKGGNLAVWNFVQNTKTLDDLEIFLSEKIRVLFDILEDRHKYSKVILEIIKYIKVNYPNPDLSVQSISLYFFMNKAYLCTLFKKETGITINKFIINYRIQISKRLIMDNQNKLANVAFQVGFTDANYFTKIFKSLEGMTPTDYREKTGVK